MAKKTIIILTMIMLILTPFLIKKNNEIVKGEIIQEETQSNFKLKRANFTMANFNTYNMQYDIEIGQMYNNEIATGSYNNENYILMSLNYIIRPPSNNYAEYWCDAYITDSQGNEELWDTDERVTIENSILTNYNYTRVANEFIFEIVWTPTQEFETLAQQLSENELLYINQWLEPQNEQLETPIIERTSKNRIEWEKIENAVSYSIEITHNNETHYGSYEEISNICYTIIEMDNRIYNIKVKARAINNTIAEDSNWSNTIEINLIPLTTPIITLDHNTIIWNNISGAERYEIYINGVLYATTTINQWTTIQNGNYYIKAIATSENWDRGNSNNSNTITQSNYNDIIGNGTNFYTLFGAIVDSQVNLIKSMLDYSVWGINFYDLIKLLVMMSITLIIVKIAIKQE